MSVKVTQKSYFQQAASEASFMLVLALSQDLKAAVVAMGILLKQLKWISTYNIMST